MAVRTPAMDALIAKVSLLIQDAAHAVISAQQVQDALDRRREAWQQEPLTEQPTRVAGAISWLHYYAGDPADPVTDWEADEVLYDNTYTLISSGAYTADELTGHWLFSTSHLPPVYLVGKTYDIYAAAADLCEIRAALTTPQYNFSTDGQSFSRGQVPVNWRALAETYRRQQRVGRTQAIRSDLAGAPALADQWVQRNTINRGRP